MKDGRTSLSRRDFLGRTLAAGAGVALAGGASTLLDACGAGGTSTATGTPGVSLAPPRRGGSIVFATASEIDGFDPVTSRWDRSGIQYARTVFDPLTAVAADGSVRPYLAQSVTPNPDHTVWTIQLRPAIYFHDGEPLTAAVVARHIDTFVHGLNGAGLSTVDTVSATGDLTVTVTTKLPWVPFPLYLTGQIGHVPSPRQRQDPNGSMHPIGTGPFIFEEWVPNDHFRATRNPRYWRHGLPYLDSIEFRPIIDNKARENSLLAGSVDILSTSSTGSITTLKHSTSVQYVDDSKTTIGEPDMNFIMFNLDSPPLHDLRVRQAIAYATDRPRLNATVYDGITPLSDGPFVPGSPYYSDTGFPKFDLARASALVRAYRAENGPIAFELGSTTSAQGLAQNQVLQQMWLKAGIKTRLAEIADSTYINNFLLGNYQAYGMTQYAAPDPDANYIFWNSQYSYPIGKLAINFSRNRDPRIDAALQTGREVADPVTRAHAYQKVAQRLAVDLPNLWLNRAILAVIARERVMNFANPALPDGSKAEALNDGVVWVGQIWVNA
jgi:peptide/nickel transport system substrate-binding protein